MSTETTVRKMRMPLERITWVALVGLAIYATITGTNWFRNYQEYKTLAETADARIEQQQSQQAVLAGELEQARAEIERLKAIPLR